MTDKEIIQPDFITDANNIRPMPMNSRSRRKIKRMWNRMEGVTWEQWHSVLSNKFTIINQPIDK